MFGGVYSDVKGISLDEINVYAVSKDKIMKSNSIHVIIKELDEVDSLENVSTEMIIGIQNTFNCSTKQRSTPEFNGSTWSSNGSSTRRLTPEGTGQPVAFWFFFGPALRKPQFDSAKIVNYRL